MLVVIYLFSSGISLNTASAISENHSLSAQTEECPWSSLVP